METPSSSLRKQGSRAIAHRLPWIDRDRGTPRGATPPTPPSIRVRNTARRSLCPSSSSIWEHWKLVFQIDATRATCSPDRGDDPLVLEVGGADLVMSVGHDLVGGEDSILDERAMRWCVTLSAVAASECPWICGRSASPTGCAFAHTPTGTTAIHRIDVDEGEGRSDLVTVVPGAIGAGTEIGRATP